MREGKPQRAVDRCVECGSVNIIYDYNIGEAFCGDCGLVIHEQMVDKGPEWRAFTQEEREARSRAGFPTSFAMHDKGLSTTISRLDHDALGKELPLETRAQMWRLRKWQIRSRTHSSADRNLSQAMAELDRLCDKTHMPSSIKERAAMIYRKALEKGLVRGRSIAAIVAASLYAACRVTKTPRALREITAASLISLKDIARCYRLLLRELDIQMPVADPAIHVAKISENAGVSGKTHAMAIEVLEEARRRHLIAGKDPVGLAAAALYIACLQNNEKKTQRDIAEAACVTEVTVRNRFKSLKRQLGLELPD